MTKCLSVARIKGTRKRAYQDREKPREGSRLRAVYDRLLTGAIVDVLDYYTTVNWGSAREQLSNFYGLEIVGTPLRGGGVRCTGAWEGGYFVPIERVGNDE